MLDNFMHLQAIELIVMEDSPPRFSLFYVRRLMNQNDFILIIFTQPFRSGRIWHKVNF